MQEDAGFAMTSVWTQGHLAVVGNFRLIWERERPLEDVVEGLVTLLAPEGSEAIQQLVDQDAKTPPVHPTTKRFTLTQ